MLHGILHQRLDGKNRHFILQSVVIHIDLRVQFGAEAQLFNLQISAHDPDLFRDPNQAAVLRK